MYFQIICINRILSNCFEPFTGKQSRLLCKLKGKILTFSSQRQNLKLHVLNLVPRARVPLDQRSGTAKLWEYQEMGPFLLQNNLVPRVHRLHGQRFSRRVKLWGNGIFFPRIHGFRLLCACLASKTEVKKSGKTEGSVAQTRRIAASGSV